MAKILIASIGAGPYQSTCYQIEDREGTLQSYENEKLTPYVLYRHLKLDRVFFIGTAGSRWDEIYAAFCRDNYNSEYYHHLAELVRQKQAYKGQLEQLEQALNNNSKCIVVDEGVSELEIWNNFSEIVQSLYELNDGDEIYIDITHAFRSLALFQFLIFNFIKDILSEKNVRIAGVYYGLYNPDKTPIINLTPLLSLTDWTKGVYILKNIGNGYLVSNLLDQQGESTAATRIRQLSDAINLNYLDSIGERSRNLQIALNQMQPAGPFEYVKPTLDEFIGEFAVSDDRYKTDPFFQLKLAEWYIKCGRYATAYITLTESIVTYICKHYDYDPTRRESREAIRQALGRNEEVNDPRLRGIDRTELGRLFKQEINPVRRHIAHASFSDIKGRRLQNAGFNKAIEEAERRCQAVRVIFDQNTLGGNAD